MPESPVQNLPLVTDIRDRDRTVLERNNEAKSMMMQDLIRYLFKAADNGGVWGVHIGSSSPSGNQNVWIDTSSAPPVLQIRDDLGNWSSVPVVSQATTKGDFETWNLEVNHPVGSLYWSKSPADPGDLFGGAWKRVKDKFIYAAGPKHDIGATGGAEEVTLNESNIPEITEKLVITGFPVVWGPGFVRGEANGFTYLDDGSDPSQYARPQTEPYGKLAPDAVSTMPPFEAYYCWERVA